MLLLGAYHGINPGMGWLFAVALGMQEEKGNAVAKALVPICVWPHVGHGHCGLTAAFLGIALPPGATRYLVAAVLFGLGIYSLVRHHHPRWVRMRVCLRDLAVWSFLIASAHGAGLMVVPVLLGRSTVEAAGQIAGHHHIAAASPLAALLATVVRTTAYLAVTGLVAWVVYSKIGLEILRKAWLNLDIAWAAALVVTSLVTLVM